MAVSLDFPFNAAHASCFALFTKSNGFVGGSVLTSPVVACLYKEYNWSKTSLDGFSLKFLLLAVASSNCFCRSIIEYFQRKYVIYYNEMGYPGKAFRGKIDPQSRIQL